MLRARVLAREPNSPSLRSEGGVPSNRFLPGLIGVLQAYGVFGDRLAENHMEFKRHNVMASRSYGHARSHLKAPTRM